MSRKGVSADGGSGGNQVGTPGQSGYPNAAISGELNWIRPLGVRSGRPTGSARNSASITCSAGWLGTGTGRPADQNSDQSGTLAPRRPSLTVHSVYRVSSHSSGVSAILATGMNGRHGLGPAPNRGRETAIRA